MPQGVKRTPLYDEHVALGARMGVFGGFEMPIEYTGVVAEHRAVRSSAGVFDICHLGEFRVFGFEAFDFLQGVLVNDLRRIAEVGKAQYTLMCDEDGGVLDDMILYHSGDLEYLMVVNAANRQTDWDALAARLTDGVELVDESDRTGLIALQGPKAIDVLRELAEEGFEPPGRFRIAEGRLDTVPVLVAGTGYTGEEGVEIFCHERHAPALWRALLSFPEVTPCGLGARDTLRLEMGYRLYGQDMDRGVDPVSAGLDWVVALDKGEFLGRDAIARVRESGPVRRLVGLRLDEGIPRPGAVVLRDGTEVGKVASGTFSPSLGAGIATAYVPADLAAVGTRLTVTVRGKPFPATVERMPFIEDTSLSAGKA